jgi:hypothetical protein
MYMQKALSNWASAVKKIKANAVDVYQIPVVQEITWMISVMFFPARPTTAPMCSSATPMVCDSWASVLAGDLTGVPGCKVST